MIIKVESQKAGKKRKRTLLQMADDIIKYAEDRKERGNIILSEFAKDLGINSETAKIWLELIFKFQNDYRRLEKGKIGRFSYLKFDRSSPNELILKARRPASFNR